MGNDNRAELIAGLATAMGAGPIKDAQLQNTRYDRTTGTFYCNGHIITANMIDKAIIYYENMFQRAQKNPDTREMALVYELALEAIRLLKNDPNKVNGFIAQGK